MVDHRCLLHSVFGRKNNLNYILLGLQVPDERFLLVIIYRNHCTGQLRGNPGELDILVSRGPFVHVVTAAQEKLDILVCRGPHIHQVPAALEH